MILNQFLTATKSCYLTFVVAGFYIVVLHFFLAKSFPAHDLLVLNILVMLITNLVTVWQWRK